jgi:hypothetical protein
MTAGAVEVAIVRQERLQSCGRYMYTVDRLIEAPCIRCSDACSHMHVGAVRLVSLLAAARFFPHLLGWQASIMHMAFNVSLRPSTLAFTINFPLAMSPALSLSRAHNNYAWQSQRPVYGPPPGGVAAHHVVMEVPHQAPEPLPTVGMFPQQQQQPHHPQQQQYPQQGAPPPPPQQPQYPQMGTPVAGPSVTKEGYEHAKQ